MLSIPAIRRKLVGDVLGRHIYLFGPGSPARSTLRRLADAGAHDGAVVLSEDAASRVSVAVILRPSLPLRAVPVFSTIATLALVEGVAEQGLSATPVWPDEVVVENVPVGRRLVETAPVGERPAYVILGADFDVPALEAAARGPVDWNEVVAALLNAIDRWSTEYAARGPAAVTGAVRFLPHGGTARALEGRNAS